MKQTLHVLLLNPLAPTHDLPHLPNQFYTFDFCIMWHVEVTQCTQFYWFSFHSVVIIQRTAVFIRYRKYNAFKYFKRDISKLFFLLLTRNCENTVITHFITAAVS